MPRDERPVIPPWRQRPTAADLAPPEAVAAELQRLEAERRRREAVRVPREHEPEDERKPEPEDEPEEVGEPTAAERQQVREAVRAHRGD
jgi:hypothetical protein